MLVHYLKNNFEYEYWANTSLLKAYKSHGFEIEVLSKIFTHIVNAQRAWLNRLGILNDSFSWDHTQGFNELTENFDKTHQKMMELLVNMDESGLKKIISYQKQDGTPSQSSVLDILTQLYHHSMYHRGQISLRLKENVISVPPNDYVVYSRSKQDAML